MSPAGLPPLFVCKVCGLPIDQNSVGVERKAVVWLKSKGTSVSRVVEELHDYKHTFCSDKMNIDFIQDALF
jgi:hypothetical protein